MFKIIDRYISGQILSTTIWAVGMLSLLLVVGNVLRDLLNQLVSHQLPISYVFAFIGNALPFSMIYSIPWGILIAVLLVFGKLSSDNELVALRANGVGIPRICLPVFFIAGVAFCLGIWINLYLAPSGLRTLKYEVLNLASHDPLAIFGSDEVIDQFPGYKIYVGRRNGSVLEDLHIYHVNANQVPIQVIVARSGTVEVEKEHETVYLHVYDAQYEERDPSDVNDLKLMRYGITVKETDLPISLDELIQKAKNSQRPTEFTLKDLQDNIREEKSSRKQVILKTEVSKRFSNSLAILTFVLVGIPMAVTAQRRETSAGIAMSLLIAFTYFIFIVLTDNVKGSAQLHPELLIWLPNLIYLTVGGILFTRLVRR